MKEKSIEAFAVELAAAAGGECHKVGHSGLEDRLVLLPGGVLGLLELKRPGEKPTELQCRRIERHRQMGFVAAWASTHTDVAEFFALLTEKGIEDPAEAFKRDDPNFEKAAEMVRSVLSEDFGRKVGEAVEHEVIRRVSKAHPKTGRKRA